MCPLWISSGPCFFNIVNRHEKLSFMNVLLGGSELFSSCSVWFTETLEVNDLPFAKESDHIIDIRIIGQAEDVIVGKAGLLLCRHVLSEIGNNIASNLHCGGGPGIARGKLRIYPGGVVHKIGIKPGGFDLILIEVACKLMDQSTHHLQVAQFLSTQRSIGNVPLSRNLRTAAIYWL